MKTVMEKKELLKVITKNRELHKQVYKEAKKAYQKKGIKLLNALKSKLEAGETIRPYIDLLIPEDHTDEYDRAIEMLKYDVREQIELEESEFSRFVLDSWEWKEAWLTTTASYVG